MEGSLASPRSGGRSRFSKALPAPPAREKQDQSALVVLPFRKDSLSSASRPALPPKDNQSFPTIPSNMATKVMEAPLPRLPALSRVNSPPTVVPKRKPVGSGASIKSARSPPPPPPAASGEVSPVESFTSLLSAYGTEDSSAARYSVDTTATKHSFTEPSPPKLPPKDSLGAVNSRLERLDIVSPLFLPTPLSSRMDTSQRLPESSPQSRRQGESEQPPTPPRKDSRMPTTPPTSRSLSDSTPGALNNQPNDQSPGHPQLWRRRSLKTDKPLAVSELKLASSHGSTASPQQVSSSMYSGHSVSNPGPSVNGAAGDSPILNGPDANSLGRTTRQSPSSSSLPRVPSQDRMGNKKSRESLDGFSQYAQEVEDNMRSGEDLKAAQHSPAKLSPEIRRPPTPEYARDEARSDDPAIYSPASPMTPPDDPRPLSIIQEDPEVSARASGAAVSSHPQPGFPPRSSSRSSADAVGDSRADPLGRTGPARPHYGTNQSSPLGTSSPVTAPATAGNAPSTFTAGLAPSPAIQPAKSTSPAHMRSTSAASVPAIQVTDDGDASTIKAPQSPRPTTSASASTMTTAAVAPAAHQPPAPGNYSELYSTPPMSPTVAKPGDPAYFPMRVVEPVAPGACLPAAPLKRTQTECFGGHYRFLASRNEDHPLACQACHIRDSGARFTCAHCAVRICADCREVLMMNGRDLEKLVEMLKK